jgi:hypothetical protein
VVFEMLSEGKPRNTIMLADGAFGPNAIPPGGGLRD